MAARGVPGFSAPLGNDVVFAATGER